MTTQCQARSGGGSGRHAVPVKQVRVRVRAREGRGEAAHQMLKKRGRAPLLGSPRALPNDDEERGDHAGVETRAAGRGAVGGAGSGQGSGSAPFALFFAHDPRCAPCALFLILGLEHAGATATGAS